MKSYLILSLLWLLFYVPHSVLALESVKSKLTKQWPFLKRYYRILYNAQSLVFFVLAYLYQIKLDAIVLIQQPIWVNLIAIVFMGISFYIMAISFRHYDKKEFLGIEQLEQASFNVAIGSTLNISGLNQYVRHPLYSATFLFLIAYFFYKPFDTTLVFVFISIIYVFIGTHLEEIKLRKQFGEQYKQYQQKVPRFIPFI